MFVCAHAAYGFIFINAYELCIFAMKIVRCSINYYWRYWVFAKSQHSAAPVHAKYGNPIKIMLKWTKFLCNITEILFHFVCLWKWFNETQETMNPFQLSHKHIYISLGLFIYSHIQNYLVEFDIWKVSMWQHCWS